MSSGFTIGVDGIDLQWSEDELKTDPMGSGFMTRDKDDHSDIPLEPFTPCYFCGPPPHPQMEHRYAKARLKGGQPICSRCHEAHLGRKL